MANEREDVPPRRARIPFAVEPDPLSQITDQVRLRSLYCGLIRVRPPLTFRSRIVDSFHIIFVTQGQLYAESIDPDGFARMLIEAGEVLVMPRGVPFRLLYPADVSPAFEVDFENVDDGSDAAPDDIEFLGWSFYLDNVHRNLLTDLLPPVIHLQKGTGGLSEWFERTVHQFRAEHRTRLPGRSSILARLAEVVFVQTLRIWVEQIPPETKGWVQGLKDERIARALRAIHQTPGNRWTVSALAHEAGMSRTAFAAQFKVLLGESPMEYVSRWRMHYAVTLLENGATTLKSVVEASGYKSAATFRTTFKRHFGVLPRSFRRM